MYTYHIYQSQVNSHRKERSQCREAGANYSLCIETDQFLIWKQWMGSIFSLLVKSIIRLPQKCSVKGLCRSKFASSSVFSQERCFWHELHCGANNCTLYILNNFVKSRSILIIIGAQILESRQNYSSLLISVITLPSETTCVNLFITTSQTLNVMTNWQLRTNTVSPMINCLINDAVLDSWRCFSSSTFLIGFW